MLERDIKSLISILEESNIDEIEVSTFWGKQNIRLKKNIIESGSNPNITKTSNKIIENKKIINPEIQESDELKTSNDTIQSTNPLHESIIKAPLVGTLYLSPKPEEPQYVNEGDIINKGDILCIIEAMKIFNEIEAEQSGKIIKILIENGTPVEFDQDLFIIKSE